MYTHTDCMYVNDIQIHNQGSHTQHSILFLLQYNFKLVYSEFVWLKICDNPCKLKVKIVGTFNGLESKLAKLTLELVWDEVAINM